MEYITKFKQASPLTKVAITWVSWATVCLTGYYFARIWAGDQRIQTLKIKQNFNDEFSEKLAHAKAKLIHEEKLAAAADRK